MVHTLPYIHSNLAVHYPECCVKVYILLLLAVKLTTRRWEFWGRFGPVLDTKLTLNSETWPTYLLTDCRQRIAINQYTYVPAKVGFAVMSYNDYSCCRSKAS